MNSPPWDTKHLYTGKDGFSQEILDFVTFLDITELEKRDREAAVRDIKAVVHSMWPGEAEVEVFGSWPSRLSLPSSDVDLSITKRPEEPDIPVMVKSIQRKGMDCKYLPHAKVPIIKFQQRQSRVHGDISFCTENAKQSAELVRAFLVQYPAAQPLIVVLKTYLRAADLNNVYTGGLSSYSVTLLVISFLQMHPYYKSEEQRQRYALSDLLIDFFAFYGKDFNYHSTTISVLDSGKYCPKRPMWEDKEKPYLLSIIDPLDPGNDVARGSFAIARVRNHFYTGYLTLQHCKSQAPPSMLSCLLNPTQLVEQGIIPLNRFTPLCLLTSSEASEDSEPTTPGSASNVAPTTSGRPSSNRTRDRGQSKRQPSSPVPPLKIPAKKRNSLTSPTTPNDTTGRSGASSAFSEADWEQCSTDGSDCDAQQESRASLPREASGDTPCTSESDLPEPLREAVDKHRDAAPARAERTEEETLSEKVNVLPPNEDDNITATYAQNSLPSFSCPVETPQQQLQVDIGCYATVTSPVADEDAYLSISRFRHLRNHPTGSPAALPPHMQLVPSHMPQGTRAPVNSFVLGMVPLGAVPLPSTAMCPSAPVGPQPVPVYEPTNTDVTEVSWPMVQEAAPGGEDMQDEVTGSGSWSWADEMDSEDERNGHETYSAYGGHGGQDGRVEPGRPPLRDITHHGTHNYQRSGEYARSNKGRAPRYHDQQRRRKGTAAPPPPTAQQKRLEGQGPPRRRGSRRYARRSSVEG